jgi:hypothetical protein
VANVIPVDVAVPGCPPPPLEILRGILTAVLGDLCGGNANPNAPPYWLGAWYLAHVAASVPEPGTGSLMLPTMLLATGFRRASGVGGSCGG